MKSLPHFALLVLAAVMIWAKLHYLILLIAALYLLVRLWITFAIRHPYAAVFIIGFLRGLFGRRR